MSGSKSVVDSSIIVPTVPLRKPFKCPSCKEPFVDPLFLPCTHVVCKACVVKLMKNSTGNPECPECAEEFPSENVSKLRAANFIQELALKHQLCTKDTTKPCAICPTQGRSRDATRWCNQCQAWYCTSCCINSHSTIPALRSHTPIDTTQGPVAAKISKESFCTIHPSNKETHVCNSCSVPLCQECLSRHRSDDVASLGVNVEARHAKLDQQKTKVEDNLLEDKDFLKQEAAWRNDAKLRHSRALQNIASNEQKLIQEVKAKMDVLRQNADTTLQRHSAACDKVIAETKQKIALGEHFIQITHHVQNAGSEADVVVLSHRLNQPRNKRTPPPPPQFEEKLKLSVETVAASSAEESDNKVKVSETRDLHVSPQPAAQTRPLNSTAESSPKGSPRTTASSTTRAATVSPEPLFTCGGVDMDLTPKEQGQVARNPGLKPTISILRKFLRLLAEAEHEEFPKELITFMDRELTKLFSFCSGLEERIFISDFLGRRGFSRLALAVDESTNNPMLELFGISSKKKIREWILQLTDLGEVITYRMSCEGYTRMLINELKHREVGTDPFLALIGILTNCCRWEKSMQGEDKAELSQLLRKIPTSSLSELTAHNVTMMLCLLGVKVSGFLRGKGVAMERMITYLCNALQNSDRRSNGFATLELCAVLNGYARTLGAEGAEILENRGAVKPVLHLLKTGITEERLIAATTIEALASHKVARQAILRNGGDELLKKATRLDQNADLADAVGKALRAVIGL